MKFVKNNAVSILITLAVLAFGLSHLQELPQQVGIHFDLSGQPNSFSNRTFAALFIPLFTLGTLWLMPTLIRISPRDFTLENSHQSISKINLAVALLLNGIQIGILMTSLYPTRYSIIPFLSISFAAFLIGLGNVISKIERNFFIGIRTPWTITSDKNWLATHRFAAKLMVSSGLFLLISTLFAANMFIAVCVVLVAGLTPILYSYLYYRRCESHNEE